MSNYKRIQSVRICTFLYFHPILFLFSIMQNWLSIVLSVKTFYCIITFYSVGNILLAMIHKTNPGSTPRFISETACYRKLFQNQIIIYVSQHSSASFDKFTTKLSVYLILNLTDLLQSSTYPHCLFWYRRSLSVDEWFCFVY